jgi:hypothetical protein
MRGHNFKINCCYVDYEPLCSVPLVSGYVRVLKYYSLQLSLISRYLHVNLLSHKILYKRIPCHLSLHFSECHEMVLYHSLCSNSLGGKDIFATNSACLITNYKLDLNNFKLGQGKITIVPLATYVARRIIRWDMRILMQRLHSSNGKRLNPSEKFQPSLPHVPNYYLLALYL